MKRILVLTICSWLIYGPLLSQKTLHAILVVDTKNVNSEFSQIGQTDYKNIRDELEQMTFETGYMLRTYEAIGDDFIPEKVEEHANVMQTDPDDVIFFYYSGASFCENGSQVNDLNRILQLGKDGKQLLGTQGILSRLQGKGARLNIFIIDGCSIEKQIDTPGITRNSTIHKVYSSLLSASGTVWVFSSKCSQYSYGNKQGSFFTNAFIDALDHFINVGSQELTWSTLLTWTQASTMKMAMEIARIQQPMFELEEG